MEAPFDNSVYKDGKWVADIWGDRQYYFMVELEEGDTVNFEFSSPVSAICFSIGDSNEYIEDGSLEFTGKVWMNESGENRIEIYVRSQNTWIYYGYFTGTVE